MDKARFWVLTVMAIASLALVIVNIVILNGNQRLQAQVSERNLYIQQSLQLEGIYQPLLRTLAELSVQHNDAPLQNLLASQGISVQVASPTPPAVVPVEPPQSTVGTKESTQ